MFNEITQFNNTFVARAQLPGPDTILAFVPLRGNSNFMLTSINGSWNAGIAAGQGFGLVGHNTGFLYWTGACDGLTTWFSFQFTPALRFGFAVEDIDFISTNGTSTDVTFGGYYAPVLIP